MIPFDKLDRVIHEKGRLSIMSLLAARREWSFQDLKAELGMTDGNIITHLRTLQKAGYVRGERGTDAAGRSRSTYELTVKGRTAFGRYVTFLEELVRSHRSEGTG